MSAEVFIKEAVLPLLSGYAKSRAQDAADPQAHMISFFKPLGSLAPSAQAHGAEVKAPADLQRQLEERQALLTKECALVQSLAGDQPERTMSTSGSQAAEDVAGLMSQQIQELRAKLLEQQDRTEDIAAAQQSIVALTAQLSETESAPGKEDLPADEDKAEDTAQLSVQDKAALLGQLASERQKLEQLQEAQAQRQAMAERLSALEEQLARLPKAPASRPDDRAHAKPTELSDAQARVKTLGREVAALSMELLLAKKAAESQLPGAHPRDADMLLAGCSWATLMTEPQTDFLDHLAVMLRQKSDAQPGVFKAIVAMRAQRQFALLASGIGTKAQELGSLLATQEPDPTKVEQLLREIQGLEAHAMSVITDMEFSAREIRTKLHASEGGFEQMAAFMRACLQTYAQSMNKYQKTFQLRAIATEDWAKLQQVKPDGKAPIAPGHIQNILRIALCHLMPYIVSNIVRSVEAERASGFMKTAMAGVDFAFTHGYKAFRRLKGGPAVEEKSELQVAADKREVALNFLSHLASMAPDANFWRTLSGTFQEAFSQEKGARSATHEMAKSWLNTVNIGGVLGDLQSQNLEGALACILVHVQQEQHLTGCPADTLNLERIANMDPDRAANFQSTRMSIA